jgi:hypothetical protein
VTERTDTSPQAAVPEQAVPEQAVPEQQEGVPVQRVQGEPGHPAGRRSSAVERYKELAGLATEAVDRMRRRDADRVAELDQALRDSQQRMALVAEQERVVRMGVRLHWEAAVEALWDERWMSVSPLPAPDESVPDLGQLHFDSELERTYQVLEDALSKRGLIRRRGSKD